MSTQSHVALAHNSVWTAVFGNPDLRDKIITHVTFKTLATTVLQLNREFCNEAQQRLRCARLLLAPPFRMQPLQILESTELILLRSGLGDDDVSAVASACASGAMAQLKVNRRLTVMASCLEPWHACSPGLTVSFDV